MGRTAGALGLAPAEEAEGPAAALGPAVAMSAAEEPAAAREGPSVGEERPWRTRGLKE